MPVINGDEFSNNLNGTASDDQIYGLGGDDAINTGILGGTDSFYGGDGDDTFNLSDHNAAIEGGIGFDQLYFIAGSGAAGISLNFSGLLSTGSATFGGRGITGVERIPLLTLTNHDDSLIIGGDYIFPTLITTLGGNDIVIGGSGIDSIFGQDGADYLVGGASNDLLYGGTGLANALQGGTGDDSYYVDAAGDSIIEFASDGEDTVFASLSGFVLPGNVENLELTAGVQSFGIGNALNNRLVGTSLYDELFGGAGDDSLFGANPLSPDKGGPNALLGGTGNDSYHVYTAGDSTIELVGEGQDTVVSYVPVHVLQANVENLYFSISGDLTGVGNALDNFISGNTGRDSLVGRDGNDRLSGGIGNANELIGGPGDDQYYVSANGDSVVELQGEGYDLIWLQVGTYTLPANVEAAYMAGPGTPATIFGNELDNALGGWSDALGNSSAPLTLYGFAGNDSLSGSKGGGNTLIGGPGDDYYDLASASDSIVELPGEGRDVVSFANANTLHPALFVLPANFEFLYPRFDANGFYGVGNANDNIIGGTFGVDTLVGLEGSDNLLGNLGGDTLFGDDGDDTLHGEGGIDTLFGGAGGDRLIGGSEADRIVGGEGQDYFHLTSIYSGIDTIDDFLTGVDKLVFLRTDLGPSGTAQLVSGTGQLTANSGNTTFFHHLETGQLGYDPDGNGPIAEMIIAILKDGLPLALTDFQFI